MSTPIDADRVLKELEEAEARRVKVAVCDLDGILRGKYLHIDKLRQALRGGFGFCDVVFGWDAADACYDDAPFTGWHTGYPDAHARLDPATFRHIPWEADMP
ncbi:MAG: glutamine synthetase, partial [bacterium]